jgi:hypothetical protein
MRRYLNKIKIEKNDINLIDTSSIAGKKFENFTNLICDIQFLGGLTKNSSSISITINDSIINFYSRKLIVELISEFNSNLDFPFTFYVNNFHIEPFTQKIKTKYCNGNDTKWYYFEFYLNEENYKLDIYNSVPSKWGISSQSVVSYYLCHSSCMKCSGPRESQCLRCYSGYSLMESDNNNKYCVCQGNNFVNSYPSSNKNCLINDTSGI